MQTQLNTNIVLLMSIWLLGVNIGEHNVVQAGISNVFTAIKDVSKGVAKDASNILPTPEGLFDSGKQLLAGYPFEFVSSSINSICSAALSSKTIAPKYLPDIKTLQFQLRTACKRSNFPLLEADKMWHSPDFDPKKKVVLLATGWTTNVNESSGIDQFAKAYACRGDVNFVAFDAAEYVDTLYTWSAFNTEELGRLIAVGLEKLKNIVPVTNIHLIGHSLGAHIVGAAGRHFNYLTGKTIARITGLDPAKPCFNEGESLSGLLRGDAEFIDVVHSNPGVLGKRNPMGDVDFYPGGLAPLITGCISVICAHGRAVEFFVETVYPGNEMNFPAKRCSSLTRLREGRCPGKEEHMGYATPSTLKGNYFMEINEEAPYGKAANKARFDAQEHCGECQMESNH